MTMSTWPFNSEVSRGSWAHIEADGFTGPQPVWQSMSCAPKPAEDATSTKQRQR